MDHVIIAALIWSYRQRH